MELNPLSVTVLGLCFVWSGFVRAGLGFGGGAIMMPFALLVLDSPIFIVPVLAVQLFLFSCITLVQFHENIDWPVALKLVAVLSIPVFAGIRGLVDLPVFWLNILVYAIVIAYALHYIFQFRITYDSRIIDFITLCVGGYVTGVSLTGSPPIVAVTAKYVPKEKLRETLFVLWAIIVSLKIAALLSYRVDLQLRHQIWLLPCAGIGHYLGLLFHQRLLTVRNDRFNRLIGIILLVVTGLGLFKLCL